MERTNGLGLTPAALAAALSGDLHNALVAATPGGIEAQEKAGQTTFVHSETLPKEMHGCTREQLEGIGFKFGADQDDLFVKATLPEGWEKRPTDHSMYSEIVDKKGRKRFTIFYKAAFYDRKADLRVERRYGVNNYVGCTADGTRTTDGVRASHWKTVVTDSGNPIHEIGIRADRDYDGGEAHRKAGFDWLNQQFPKWEDAFAYWD